MALNRKLIQVNHFANPEFVFEIPTKTAFHPEFLSDRPEYNEMFIQNTEIFCNDVLDCVPYGYLTLNDVLSRLFIDPIKIGYWYGWLKGRDKIKIEITEQTEDHIRIKITTGGDIWEDIPNG